MIIAFQKITLFIMLTISAVALFALFENSVHAKKVRGYDDRILQQWYAGYNESLFDGELPTDTQVVWADLSSEDALGMTTVAGNKYKIEIDVTYNKAPVTMHETLIHEMCHVEVEAIQGDESGDHGPDWQDCMMHIAKRGGFEGIW